MSSSNLFSDSTSIDSGVDDLQNPKYEYTGNFDQQGFRNGYGCQTWDRPFKHKYAGSFLYNNMHDKGFYFIKQEDGTSFYDGQFHNNKLEGYGQVISSDGKIHEGLFKDNRKFGPGVLSYPDGTQDVGLWNGNYLIRLSISVSSDIVPSLCNSSVSKIKLLRFKKIVPAVPKRKDIAKDLLSGLNEEECFSQIYPELYNPHVRNEHSLFFDRRLYDLAQLGSEDTLIEVLEDEAFVDSDSELLDSEDAACPCSNDRCAHVSKQISEIENELLKIHNMKGKYEHQLKKCKTCCKATPKTPHSNMSEHSLENSSAEVKKYPTEISIIEVINVSSKQGVEKNLDQMRLGMSNIEITANTADSISNETMSKTMLNPKKEESVSKIFMSAKEFNSGQSSYNSDQEIFYNATKNYTCTCMDEDIPDADFLMEQLEKLEGQENFYQTILQLLNRVLYKEFSTVNKSSSSKIIKLQVEDLLTWNNGRTAIEILQHSFRYRNFENILSFNIKSIFIGDRRAFGKVGSVEATCINFLKHCVNNQLYEVRRGLLHHNIYPDLADARGNTGLHFAVTGNCHQIIRQLANVGANLDAFNDECLTPLLLSILRYLATLNRVAIWEEAFLSEIILNSSELEQVAQWRPHESLVSLSEFVGSCTHLNKIHRSSTGEMKKSTEKMQTKLRSRLQSYKSNSIAMKINLIYLLSTSFIDDYEKYKKAVASKVIKDVDAKDVEPIAQTIELLLQYGADPNIGDLPMKPLLLAIFTKNINLVENLLKHGGNSDSVTEEDLTALHILSALPFSLENVRLAEKLLEYSSDPNMKCGNDFWLEHNEELIGTYINPLTENRDYGRKTPLQLIAMRKDFDEDNVCFQCDLVRVLIENGALHLQYYLGHTLLSLAVLRGNITLIETLHSYVDLGQPLGENMGNALTVLGLCRFPFLKSFGYCKKTIDTLITLGMNPFNPVYDFSNVFEFFLNEYAHNVDFDIPRIRAHLEVEDISFRKAINSGDPNIDENCNKLSVAYIKEIGRNILIILGQYKSIQVLLHFAALDLLYHKCLENMAKFFTIPEALDCLKVLINQNKIKMDSDYQKIILKLLNFISDITSKITKKTSGKYAHIAAEPTQVLEEEVLKLSKNIQVPNYIAMYALDSNPEKYEVCFHCLRKSNRKLLCCPCCGSINFCSELCNENSNKLDTKHFCNLLFYDKKQNVWEKPNENVPLAGIDLLMHEAKQTREQERLAELKQRQAEVEEKLKKRLQKPQKLDSQLAFHGKKSPSKTATEGSASASVGSKKEICCRKPSDIFMCDQMAQLQSRKLNCGFHCGQVIPDVHLDEKGNIVREQEFCECYPLYKKDTESLKSKDGKDQNLARTGNSKDKLSAHYSLSEIYGGALSVGNQIVEEAKNLETLLETSANDKIRMNVISEYINPDDTETEKITDPALHETETHKEEDEKRNISDIDRTKKKRRYVKHQESMKESTANPEYKKEMNTRADKDGKKSVKEGKGKKVKSDTEIMPRKTNKTKKDASRLPTSRNRKNGKYIVSKSKPESEPSVLDEKKKKKISAKKETHSKSAMDSGNKKTKRKEKLNKRISDYTEHDKKIMTRKYRRRKEFDGKKVKTQVVIKIKGKKKTESSTKSLVSKIKKLRREKGYRMKKSRTKKTDKKKGSEKHKIKESRKQEGTNMKKIAKPLKRIGMEKTTKEEKKLHQIKSKYDEKSKSISFDQADKTERYATIGRTLVSMRALDAHLQYPKKIMALSGNNYEKFQRISKVYQYFLELIAKYFPDFDMSCLMFPFACFLDGQLYYKFSDALPYYCRTYSAV